MGNTKFVRFYSGLREIEKMKARDAKLAKDSGGASKTKQKKNVKVRIFISFYLSFTIVELNYINILLLMYDFQRLAISSFSMQIGT